jgi:hypothetical protein
VPNTMLMPPPSFQRKGVPGVIRAPFQAPRIFRNKMGRSERSSRSGRSYRLPNFHPFHSRNAWIAWNAWNMEQIGRFACTQAWNVLATPPHR